PSSGDLRVLRAFPTRRSSDLGLCGSSATRQVTDRWATVSTPTPTPQGKVWRKQRPSSLVSVAVPEVIFTTPPPSSPAHPALPGEDRKSTRLNSSHVKISYAVF